MTSSVHYWYGVQIKTKQSLWCVLKMHMHIFILFIYFLHLHEWRKYNTKTPPQMELYNKAFMYTVIIKYTYHI